jgi:hypothetical protein
MDDVVETKGEFKLRYGYNSSMTLGNVFFALEQNKIDPYEVGQVIGKMANNGIQPDKMANYLADYYKLFGW